jgi:type I restriction enzyme S subunit
MRNRCKPQSKILSGGLNNSRQNKKLSLEVRQKLAVTMQNQFKEHPVSWPLVRLGDCCAVVGGATPKREVDEFWNSNDVPWVTPKDISKLNTLILDDAPEYISKKGLASCAAQVLPTNSLLLTSRAPIGNVAITGRPMATNQGFKSLIPSDQVDVKYLYYCLMFFSRQLDDCGNGATFKEVSKKIVENFEIPLPPLETQKQIAAILEKADQLRKDCQQMEQELNSLAQSVFMDMFGDPVTNPKGWKKKPLSALVESTDDIKCGPFGTQLGKNEFVTSGIPLWGIKHVNTGFKKPTHEFVTEKKFEDLKSYSIKAGDIVMTRKGNVGNCYIYPQNLETGVMHSDLLRIRPDVRKINPHFLQKQFMYSRDIEAQIQVISQGAIMAGINVTKLKSLSVLCPSLNIQEKFAATLKEIYSRNDAVKEKGDQATYLFEALMQKAFKGESLAGQAPTADGVSFFVGASPAGDSP